MSEEQLQQISQRMGLDRPLAVQYFDFLWDMVRFDFGNALTQGGNGPIIDEIGEKLPATIELTIPAILLTALIGVGSGAYAAKNRKSPADYTLRFMSIAIYSIPVFFLGLVFQIIFAVRLNILPLYGRMEPVIQMSFNSPTNFYVLDSILTGNWPAFRSALAHLVLPGHHTGPGTKRCFRPSDPAST